MRTSGVLFVLAFLAGCGYVGEPQYPALNIPTRVNNLGAMERGSQLEIGFTVPALTTEGLVVKSIGAVDLRVGPPGRGPFQVDAWAEKASRIDVAPPAKLGNVQVKVPVEKFIGQDIVVAVRLANSKNRVSDWSNVVKFHVERPLSAPTDFAATGAPDGIRLTWKTSDAPGFRILRSSDAEPQPLPIATAAGPEYLDATATYGKKYQYYVEAVKGAVESEPVGPISIAYTDTFPPAAPSALAAIAGVDAIELTWERNTEPDFRGYRVYRAVAAGAFERIAEMLEAPNYSDRKVTSGTRYRYAVTSIDQIGNESERTPPVEVLTP